jgi:hypothetical protein
MMTITQRLCNVIDSQRNKSRLHKLSLAWAMAVSQDGPFRAANRRNVAAECGARHHQGLENQLIDAPAVVVANDGAICRHARLGGTFNYYYREAA